MKILFVLVVLTTLVSFISAYNYVVDAELQGGSSASPSGDMFGNANIIISKYDSGNGKTLSIIGAVFGDGNNFPNGTVMPEAGRVYFYERNHNKWEQFQKQFVGESANNQAGGGVAAGLTPTGWSSRSHVCADGWLFIPEPGTPINASNLDQKDFSGLINVFQFIDGEYKLVQRIYNPDGNGPDQFYAEFGISIDYSNGWLITGGGVTNAAWLFSIDHSTNQWVPRQKIITGSQKGNMISAIGGDYAFVQVAIDPANFPANDQVLVYKRTGPVNWTYQQTLQGFNNAGPYLGTVGDLFGSTMSIGGQDNRWAIIGAPGDGQYAGTSGYAAAGAVYFVYLQDDGLWTITQKEFSDSPTLYYGLGNCIGNNNIAYVADPGRTVGSNPFQGSLREYVLHGHTWSKHNLLTDPHGRAYDLLGISSTADEYVQAGDFRFAFNFLPPLSFTVPTLPGRTVIWKRTY